MSLLKVLLLCSCLVAARVAASEDALEMADGLLTEGSQGGGTPEPANQQTLELGEDPESTSDDMDFSYYDAMASDRDTDSEAPADTSDDADWLYDDYKYGDAMFDDASSSSSDISDSDNDEELQPPPLQ